MRVFGIVAGRAWMLATGMLAGCAPIVGFPNDPATSSALSVYYGPQSEAEYDKTVGDDARTAVRDRIVRYRLHGYDLEYSDFKRALASQGNVASVGGGLAILTLSGIAATTGHVATAGAMAASTAGIVGAQGLINKELYFQKTLPALVAQMDASRDKVIARILDGLATKDSVYPLVRANVDLARLKDAGSIEGAIGTISEKASEAKAEAAKAVTIVRDPTYVMTRTGRQTILQRITSLDGADVVKLANKVLPDLAVQTQAVRTTAQRYKPEDGAGFTEAQVARARLFLNFWVDGETMSPDRLDYWARALNSIR